MFASPDVTALHMSIRHWYQMKLVNILHTQLKIVLGVV